MRQIVLRALDEPSFYRLKQLAWQTGKPLDEMARSLLMEAVQSRAASGSRGEKAIEPSSVKEREMAE